MKRKRSPFPREDYVALELYVPDRQAVEVDLSDNTNLWGTHPAALRAVNEATADDLARYPYFYADEVRKAAAERFGVGPGNVCTGCGSDDILDSAFRAAAGPGGVVAYAAPTFPMVEPLARMNGRGTHAVAWSAALADPRRLLEGDPVLVYVCRPNNPTGSLAPGAWVRELLDAAGSDGPLVLLDEAYADFAGEGESFAGEAAGRSRLLVARTLSKAFGLAGLRVGIGIGSPEVVMEVEKSRGPYKVNRLAEVAAAAALRDEGGWVTRTVAECVESRERLVAELERRGLEPIRSASNFVMIPVGDGCALRHAAALRERGVAVRPFPGSPDVGDGIRATVGPWPLMERFLEALDAVLGMDSVPPEDEVVELDIDGREATL